jgi:hypothetical protein
MSDEVLGVLLEAMSNYKSVLTEFKATYFKIEIPLLPSVEYQLQRSMLFAQDKNQLQNNEAMSGAELSPGNYWTELENQTRQLSEEIAAMHSDLQKTAHSETALDDLLKLKKAGALLRKPHLRLKAHAAQVRRQADRAEKDKGKWDGFSFQKGPRDMALELLGDEGKATTIKHHLRNLPNISKTEGGHYRWDNENEYETTKNKVKARLQR